MSGWHLYSSKAIGVLGVPTQKRLPKKALVSGDGLWAEVVNAQGEVQEVYVKLGNRQSKRRQHARRPQGSDHPTSAKVEAEDRH